MDKSFKKRTEVNDQLLDTFLCLMEGDIKTMIYEKTDRLIYSAYSLNIHQLDAASLRRLKTSLLQVERLRQNIKANKGREETTATIAMICDSPVHVRLLQETGIVTLADLVNCDPLKLMDVLDIAEKESGIVHLHLYCWRWFQVDMIVGQALRKHWNPE